MAVLGGRRNTSDNKEGIKIDITYHGEEEEMDEDDINENNNDDGQKPKEISTPL
jgi:hypothetical protein